MNKPILLLLLSFTVSVEASNKAVEYESNTGAIINNITLTSSNQTVMLVSPTTGNHLMRRVDITSPTIAFTATNAVPPTVNAQVVNGGNRLIISSAIKLQTGTTTSQAGMSLYSVLGTTTNIFGPCQITNVITSPTIMQLIGYIQPSATYWYTNAGPNGCSGTASATINSSSQQHITY